MTLSADLTHYPTSYFIKRFAGAIPYFPDTEKSELQEYGENL